MVWWWVVCSNWGDEWEYYSSQAIYIQTFTYIHGMLYILVLKDNQSRVIYITMSLYYIYSLNGIVGEVILYITHIHIYIYNLTIPDPEIYVK